ncbi:MAG: hypothetical protein JHC26_09635 [Thermofilum sp.]|uniref:hypothetical protein n=1 Tax=Thermofilum sp. TaxID=1961369 RepID=UPI0025865881|nr:hypothetical protein [Thermofilum sp.]MCI4409342.1 hypothetical protein [Thermofilum sp.]
MSQEKIDLFAVEFFLIVALLYIVIGLVVARETKNITKLFRFLAIGIFLIISAEVRHWIHIVKNSV